MAKASIALASLLTLLAGSAHADADTEARIRQLTEGLRCVVCQNQSVADSNAPIAADLRARARASRSKSHGAPATSRFARTW
ncbi:cytochrome c-type biogenesis protein CcmH [Candidatus Burkholderia verschuerenii]|uniref:cytochrome c-type biogenesis protein CcmH n=1 Tax=Candidatus Burkholderia verschuerenii TaxID=242163 RepID=UPI000AB94B5E